jgi:FkbH-like protein
MSLFIYRNSTVESLFSNFDAKFSGYDDISEVPLDIEAYIWCYFLPIRFDHSKLSDEISSYYYNIELLYNQIPSTKSFFIFNLSSIYTNIIETGNFKLSVAIDEFNMRIIKLANDNKNIKIIDFKSFVLKQSTDKIIDWKYYYLSKMIINPKITNDFRFWFNQEINSIEMKRKKCLILDLDNTLWGGILGEDGISGIKIGGDYPGNAFLDFQKAILELYKSGVILAVCSKNNESDVFEAWDKNPNILIKKEHLALYRINWQNKAENIASIIKQLNIGADSIVFLDDNPAEREIVKQFLPSVETPDFPSRPYMLPVFIKTVSDNYFKTYQLTQEDKSKTKQYKENTKREEFQKGFVNFDEYLSSLEIEIKVQQASTLTIPRIAQMTQKTNQFNLTTRRYSESDILSFIQCGNWVYTVSVSDRFGDNGITGLVIINIDKTNVKANIDSLLLSCRILGKGIEEAFMFTVFEKLKKAGIQEIEATYIQSAKNEQVKSFYDKLGFQLNTNTELVEETNKDYYLNFDNKEFKIKSFYKIIE